MGTPRWCRRICYRLALVNSEESTSTLLFSGTYLGKNRKEYFKMSSPIFSIFNEPFKSRWMNLWQSSSLHLHWSKCQILTFFGLHSLNLQSFLLITHFSIFLSDVFCPIVFFNSTGWQIRSIFPDSSSINL